MRTRSLLCFLACLAFLLTIPPFAQTSGQEPAESVTAIVGAQVIDGTGAPPSVQTVVIRGDRIAAVGSGAEVPAGARVIHAEGKTLIPGLFDLHTHLPYATAGSGAADWPKNLKAYLYCGVTTVNDFGTYSETFAPMRRLIASGEVPGPRISFAARFTTPGGHGAEGGRGDIFSLEVLTPREARAAVRKVLPYHPDVIKVFTDGWRYGTAPEMTSMDEATLAALVDEAHKNQIKVLTHTVTLARAKIAARAGVDALAHGVGDAPVDQELIDLMKKNGTMYVPTLAVYEPRGSAILSPVLAAVLDPAVRAAIRPPLSPPVSGDEKINQAPAAPAAETPEGANPARTAEVRRLREQRWKYMLGNVTALYQAGIRIGTGTDAGVTGTHHGWATLRELELLVQGGVSPLDAITAATGASAKAMALDAERGTIAAGKLADLVLVDGAPEKDIRDIEKIARVFLGGKEIDRERLAREIASPELTPIHSASVAAKIDDFESAEDGRSAIGTLWINATDPGLDNSRMVFGRTLRKPGDHALSLMARMSEKDRPYVRVIVPLSAGAIVPVDISGYRGVSFDVRGDGEYQLVMPTRSVRNNNYHQAAFRAEAKWRTVKIDFARLQQAKTEKPVAWNGKDVLMLVFEAARPSGQVAWLELDNVRLYK